jgi:acetylornithine deacetylase/succinyl-diaminopimelate desuccinylase family protein
VNSLRSIQERITANFHQDEVIGILRELIQKQSENPLGTEEEAGRYVQALLAEHGIKAELSWAAPGRPNVIARLQGMRPGPSMIYNGHLDVVPAGNQWSMDPFAGIVQDGRVYGRGAADMKSGVAAMIYAAIVLQRLGNPFAGELILFFNADEERGNLGMKHFLTTDLTADWAVISEPTELNICIAHRGVSRYRIQTLGTPGHAAVVTNPDNAIYKMNKIIHNLESLGNSLKKRVDPLLGSASLNVTQIQGGTAPNIVPGSCVIEIDRRILPSETYEEILQEIRECVEEVADVSTYELECSSYLAASQIAPDHPLVKGMEQANRLVREQPCQVKIFEATCEAPFFSVDKGIPTVVFGPGSLSQAHVNDEYVEIAEVVDASRIFVHLALHMLREQGE